MNETDIAYIAGLLDGEAYIGIKKSPAYKCQGLATPGYHARIQIRMVDEDAIRFVAECLGGWYYNEKPHSEKGRLLYCYQASDKKAENILRIVLPYLRVKRRSADVVLRFRDLKSNARKYQTKITGYRMMPGYRGGDRKVPNLSFSDEFVEMCEALYLEAKRLNHAE